MKGHFETCLVPLGPYTDEDFVRAFKEGHIDQLVNDVGPKQRTSFVPTNRRRLAGIVKHNWKRFKGDQVARIKSE